MSLNNSQRQNRRDSAWLASMNGSPGRVQPQAAPLGPAIAQAHAQATTSASAHTSRRQSLSQAEPTVPTRPSHHNQPARPGRPEQAISTPDKRSTLSRALQRANTAVILDNAHNFDAAMEAYVESCQLLQRVMERSPSEEDKRKLAAIKIMYDNRIAELVHLCQPSPINPPALRNRSLPPLPPDESNKTTSAPETESVAASAPISPTKPTGQTPDLADSAAATPDMPPPLPTASKPVYRPSRSSIVPTAIGEVSQTPTIDSAPSLAGQPEALSMSQSQSPDKQNAAVGKPIPPAPLKTNRSRASSSAPSTSPATSAGLSLNGDAHNRTDHGRTFSSESTSWLDTIDESGVSSGASERSHSPASEGRTASLTQSVPHLPSVIDSPLGINAAMDEAIEAIFEGSTDMDDTVSPKPAGLGISSSVGDEREASIQRVINAARLSQAGVSSHAVSTPDKLLSDMDDDLLDTIVEHQLLGPVSDGASLQSANTVPTINHPSSAGGQPRQADEDRDGSKRKPLAVSQKHNGKSSGSRPPSSTISLHQIESSLSDSTTSQLSESRQNESAFATIMSSLRIRPGSRSISSNTSRTGSIVSDHHHHPSTPASGAVDLHKSKSTISLHGGRARLGSGSGNGNGNGTATPFSPPPPQNNPATSGRVRPISRSSYGQGFSILPGRRPTIQRTYWEESQQSSQLFDSDFHSPRTPGTPNSKSDNAPIPLEACPESPLLRPYWLMRCLYQTLAHPKGGYITTRLFIPRDVWRVRGIKIRAVEEKTATCDLLTAALAKLSAVDMYDANAVLDELQTFESLLDAVQANLSKKLGNEVGVAGASGFWKDLPTDADSASVTGGSGEGVGKSIGSQLTSSLSLSKTAGQARTYFSLRKLRQKATSSGLAMLMKDSAGSSVALGGQDGKAARLGSVPMTPLLEVRIPKRKIAQADFSGHNSMYVSSVARLFDAAQIIDQITRQVEDPGLKHSSSTQVGIELCARHASDFFAFYICRFVLTDLTNFLDKYIKRGSEWAGA